MLTGQQAFAIIMHNVQSTMRTWRMRVCVPSLLCLTPAQLSMHFGLCVLLAAQVFYTTHILGFICFMLFAFIHFQSMWAYTLSGIPLTSLPNLASATPCQVYTLHTYTLTPRISCTADICSAKHRVCAEVIMPSTPVLGAVAARSASWPSAALYGALWLFLCSHLVLRASLCFCSHHVAVSIPAQVACLHLAHAIWPGLV